MNWQSEMQEIMMKEDALELQLYQALTGQTIPIALGTKLQHICSYCKTAHDKQFCPGCGASKEGKP